MFREVAAKCSRMAVLWCSIGGGFELSSRSRKLRLFCSLFVLGCIFEVVILCWRGGDSWKWSRCAAQRSAAQSFRPRLPSFKANFDIFADTTLIRLLTFPQYFPILHEAIHVNRVRYLRSIDEALTPANLHLQLPQLPYILHQDPALSFLTNR
ncbi:hypothetical protein VTL71DRAFT_16056 [Oculimacula yallundae]|uniref:Uncharacterized protein n=1 Tax=Oculimacula yallundae TaxID=86028 RepID=A0ABR4CFR7_9HELO